MPIIDEYLFETKEFWVEIAKELKEIQSIVSNSDATENKKHRLLDAA